MPLVNEITRKIGYEKSSFTALQGRRMAIFSTHQNKAKINPVVEIDLVPRHIDDRGQFHYGISPVVSYCSTTGATCGGDLD